MNKYDPKSIEQKWQEFWESNKTFEVKEDSSKRKFYGLVEFPYPSGAGLHVGHPRSYTAMDVIARKRRMEGYNVLYPMGFDSFGLPTENFAIKTGRPPIEITQENITTFTRQLKALGFSFDWSRAVTTSEPEYYKWTQWIFLQLYKHGLAYKKKQPINWCPKDKIGLANEEVVDGKCERCGGAVEKRDKEQWMLAITKYADKLLEGLNEVDYIERAKLQQQNWIGKSEGATVRFPIKRHLERPPTKVGGVERPPVRGAVDMGSFAAAQDDVIEVFTTRPDTLFGATYMVVAPEHPLIVHSQEFIANRDEVMEYVNAAKHKTDLERTELQKEKTGVELKGIKAINPATNEEIPVWVADYVLGSYGTGAIMAVPAHDERDFEFATRIIPMESGEASDKYIRHVVEPVSYKDLIPYHQFFYEVTGGKKYEVAQDEEARNDLEKLKQDKFCFPGKGIVVNSDFLNGLSTSEAKAKIIAWLEEKGIGQRKVQYKLRDWVFSRQRYWGEPIPLVHCENCANKKQKALLIHGFEGSGEGNWFPWMKKQLEAQGFEVFAPSISTAAHPTVDSWLEELLPIVKDFGEEDIIIGHSLGSKAALHLLEKSKKKIKHLYLVASAIGEMMERDWDLYRREWKGADVDALKKFWETPVSFEKINKLAGNVTVILSDDDPWIQKKTHENLPVSWTFQLWHGYKHISMVQSPELLEVFLKSKNTAWIPLPEKELPLKLPEVQNYQPTDTGESPLAAMTDWVNTKCPNCGGPARRETDTMPNWAGSSWYYLAYLMQGISNFQFPISNYRDAFKYWLPIDWYNGGMEHTVLHLLYSRFWNQFLYDIGVVPTLEPYKKRTSHGMILASDGQKMSKSLGNVINPDDMVKEYGADALRTYTMFMGPFDQMIAWDTNGLIGVRRFLERVWKLQEKVIEAEAKNDNLTTLVHQTIKKVSSDIEKMGYNTAIAALMEFTNTLTKEEKISKAGYCVLIKLLSPFAPHIAEELWEEFGDGKPLAYSAWPVYDEALTQEATLTIAIQVNGKLRDTIELSSDTSEQDITAAALASEKVQKYLEGKQPKKVIYVKGKLVSIVV